MPCFALRDYYATVLATMREVQHHIIGPFHFLLGFNLVNLLIFAILIISGLMLRQRPEFHKRLMLLATVSILAPAVARIALLFNLHSAAAQLVSFYCCVLIFIAVDTVRHRRLHPAMAWGGVAIMGPLLVAFYAVQTKSWINFVTRAFS